ncbi:MAG: nucleotidyltransferase family protein [Gemmataceae bacterium]|nr:nucleotidyltransferase family protein [Gemmataceae bacterium]
MVDQNSLYAPDDPAAVECYRNAARALKNAGLDFLVGGAYSFARYTGIARPTKDFDIFIRPPDRDRALEVLAAIGFRTEVAYEHWLAKAFHGDHFIDLIYNSGNATVPVDDGWFEHAVEAEVFGERVLLCPPEESLWSKAFIMERHRYDGADIAHILLAVGDHLDWVRLLNRFGRNWRVLYSHLILFGFVYPADRTKIPGWVMRELNARLRAELESAPPDERVCNGTLLTTTQYLPDLELWGYRDGRLGPHGTMTPKQIADWTEGVITGR